MATTEYLAPTSLTEALALLDQHGDSAKVISGGQSLVPMMNLRLVQPERLIDIGRLPELRYIRVDGSSLLIGGLTTHAEIEESALLRQICPLLPATAGLIGHPQIRNRGTIGGSLAHADPAAEWPMIMTCLGAEIVVASAAGERLVAAGEFFLTVFTTTLAPNELVVGVKIPLPSANHGWSIQELSKRAGDFAMASAGAVITRNSDGHVASVSLTIGNVDSVPINASEIATATLVGTLPSPALFKEVALAAVEGIEAEGDMHCSADYRLELAATLASRALREAWFRAGGDKTPSTLRSEVT